MNGACRWCSDFWLLALALLWFGGMHLSCMQSKPHALMRRFILWWYDGWHICWIAFFQLQWPSNTSMPSVSDASVIALTSVFFNVIVYRFPVRAPRIQVLDYRGRMSFVMSLALPNDWFVMATTVLFGLNFWCMRVGSLVIMGPRNLSRQSNGDGKRFVHQLPNSLLHRLVYSSTRSVDCNLNGRCRRPILLWACSLVVSGLISQDGIGLLWEKNTVDWLISAGWNQQANMLMFSEDLFVSIESWELYLHKKRRLLVILLGP